MTTPAAVAPPPPPFGLLFTGSRVGYPILSTAFAQAGPTQWVLDLRSVVAGVGGIAAAAAAASTTTPWEAAGIRDATLFLSAPGCLPAGAGLGLYVAVVDSSMQSSSAPAWQYRGCVADGKPSDAFPLSFPSSSEASPTGGDDDNNNGPSFSLATTAMTTKPTPTTTTTALVGVSVEPAAELASRESSALASKLDFGRRVGLDLYRYAESFAPAGDPAAAAAGVVVLPPRALDSWWKRFESKFRRDPDFLLRMNLD